MADPDLTAFLVGFSAVAAGLGLYLLHLARRLSAIERALEKREPRRPR